MIFYKDQFISKNDAHISPDDRGYYFGDGVYEVFRIYASKLYEKEAHLNRLKRSAAELQIPLPYPVEEMEATLDQLVELSRVANGTLYMQITRGEAPRSHPFPASTQPVMYASCTEVHRPISTIQGGISAITMDDIRWLRCDIKSLNLLPNILAKQAAIDRGVGEVILHRNGTVTECSASNLMIIRSGILLTHPANNLILHGITRAVVLKLARQLEIEVKEEAFNLEVLGQADEAFITGTTVEITPITEIDGTAVNQGAPGPVTRRLQEHFERTLKL